jgi:peptidoglycan/LPS O-acetylase OafA/YrhL
MSALHYDGEPRAFLPEAKGGGRDDATAVPSARVEGKRIDDVEVLRAFAVIFVLFNHLSTTMPYTQQWYWHVYKYFTFWGGVDLFFAISGFVIARDLLNRLSHAPSGMALPTFIAFWLRRIWRIYPAAWAWLALMLVLTLAYNKSGHFGSFRSNFGDTVAAVAQVANLHFYGCGKGLPGATCGINGIYWSLSLEEQFYLILPAALLLPKRWLVITLSALLFVQIITPREIGDLSWNLRTDALIIGVLIAIASRQPMVALLEPRRCGTSSRQFSLRS